MEGYLLALSKDRDAQLWFCVLELGVLRCFVKPNGALVDTLPLTRHSVRVVAHSDGVCPNEFAVCTVAVQFDETRAKLRLQRDQERVSRFAAPSPDKMRKWGRAITNWKRYAFVEPTPTATSAAMADAATPATARRAAQREEARTLISFVTSFELRLKQTVPKKASTKGKDLAKGTRSSMVSSASGTSSAAKRHDRLSLTTTGRSSLASWIPVRVRGMWTSSPPPEAS
jgi:hypothetical protein